MQHCRRNIVGRGRMLSAFALLAAVWPAVVRGQAPGDLPVTRIERLEAVPAQLQTAPVTRPASQADLDGPRTVTLLFPRPAPVRAVLSLLLRGTPVSVVVDSAVRATFSGELRNLTLRQALEAVVFGARLDYDLRGTVIHVFPRRPATRLFQVDLLAVRRGWHSQTGAGDAVLTSTGDSDPYADIARGVASLLSGEGRFHVDRRAGLVQVTDFRDRLDQVALYLEALQLRATRQVRIEARVYRLTLPDGAIARDASAAPGIVTDVRSAVASLEAAGTASLVGSPALLTMNNEAVVVRVSAAGGPDPGASGAPPRELSIIVTPQISADGFIQLSVTPHVTETGSSEQADSGTRLGSDTVVRLKEGETVMISGMTSGRVRRTEWVVLLTPSLVTTVRTLQAGGR